MLTRKRLGAIVMLGAFVVGLAEFTTSVMGVVIEVFWYVVLAGAIVGGGFALAERLSRRRGR